MIRPAVLSDLVALVALEEECEGADAWSQALVREGVAGLLPTTTWWVADRSGPEGQVNASGVTPAPIGGYAVVSLVDDVAELQRIGVTAACRRRGIARELLDAVIERSRSGAVRLLLEVREDNAAALALYRGAGFAEISRRPRYYRDGATAIVMERHLREGGA